jgi:hypothetical protein
VCVRLRWRGPGTGPEPDAYTNQKADSEANADQNGVNANVPVLIGGKDMHGGDSAATQDAANTATSSASNTSTTDQYADQSQSADSHCLAGCGGAGQAQNLDQSADTRQDARSTAIAGQTNVNANVPVTIIVIVHTYAAPAPHFDGADHAVKEEPKAKEPKKVRKAKRHAKHRKDPKGRRYVGAARRHSAALR